MIAKINLGTVPNDNTGDTRRAGGLKINGFMEAVRPFSHRKLVYIGGSSVAAGVGASSTANGWAGLLAAKLVARGYTVVNTAVSGRTTVDVINGFYTEVQPFAPDFFVISLSLRNEGIVATGDAAYVQWLTNISKLVRMCRQQGIIPILTTPYVADEFGAAEYRYTQSARKDLETLGVALVDFLPALDDGTGHFIPGSAVDLLHPNDAGHSVLDRSFPPSLLDRWVERVIPQQPEANSWMQVGADDNVAYPLRYDPVDPFGAFTFAFRFKNVTPNVGCAIAGYGVIGSGASRFRNPGAANYQLTNGAGSVDTGLTSADTAWHHVAITRNAITNIATLYFDGASIGTIAEATSNPSFILAGRPDGVTTSGIPTLPQGFHFRDVTLHRVNLPAADIKRLWSGSVPPGSLEIYSPMADPSFGPGMRVANLAPTEARFKINCTVLSPYSTAKVA